MIIFLFTQIKMQIKHFLTAAIFFSFFFFFLFFYGIIDKNLEDPVCCYHIYELVN